MFNASANLNIMIKTARSAASGLLRDFGEVENLQVSSKAPGDFVSKADIKSEKIIFEALSEARPNYGWLAEESEEKTETVIDEQMNHYLSAITRHNK